MRIVRNLVLGSIALLSLPALFAQESDVTPSSVSVVPHVIKYSGALPDAPAAASVVEVKFALYAGQKGGDVLWTETQQVALDPQSRYAVLLGSTTAAGLPHELFVSGTARWLGVTLAGAQESPRTLVSANAYALKASDAETLGGHPASDFVLVGKNANPDASVDITHITAGTGIIVSGNGTATVTVGINSAYLDGLGAQFALLHGANTFVGNQTITGNLLTSGTFTTPGGAAKLKAGGAVDITYAGGVYTIGLDGTQGEAFGNGLWSQLKAANTFTKANTFNGAVTVNNELSNIYQSAGNYNTVISNEAPAGGGIEISSAVIGIDAAATDSTPGDQSIGVYGTSYSADGQGVYGAMANQGGTGAGVYGVLGTASTIGGSEILTFQSPGIWADAGDKTSGSDRSVALLASSDADNAGIFVNSSDGFYSLFTAAFSAGGYPFGAINASTGDSCAMDSAANFTCDGSITGAVKAAGSDNRVAVHAITSPENWIEDFGSGTISSGAGHVDLEPRFLSTVNTGVEYHVFLSPEGESKGLYIANKSAGGFDVREIGGGTSNIAFSYRIVAKRVGMESARLEDLSKNREMMKRQMAKRPPHPALQPVRMQQHGSLLPIAARPR